MDNRVSKGEVMFELVICSHDGTVLKRFDLARVEAARKRVVVKRPRLAPSLGGMKPDFVVEGKSGRFDVYLATNQSLA